MIFDIKIEVVKEKISKKMGVSDLYLYLNRDLLVVFLNKLTHNYLRKFHFVD